MPRNCRLFVMPERLQRLWEEYDAQLADLGCGRDSVYRVAIGYMCILRALGTPLNGTLPTGRWQDAEINAPMSHDPMYVEGLVMHLLALPDMLEGRAEASRDAQENCTPRLQLFQVVKAALQALREIQRARAVR